MLDLTVREWALVVAQLVLLLGFVGVNIEIIYLKRRLKRLESPALHTPTKVGAAGVADLS